ncbi:glycosyltransferase 61 family protein [Nocardioides sp.]|uniref:glycosyltransferase family 61 protein n=1 Tax=Nocardioides sp. TaxID=35761 RepID=UPI001A326285|nr:glycosyltransferase 61 family protein [Nocardioides sp.]MBJ7356962.1 glycosyltransferase family 61 protein [Nocardioides sp.]
MPWTVPAFPAVPSGDHAAPPGLVTVDEVFLTRVEHGPIATTVGPTRWLRGAVHLASGDLVKPSQKLCAGANTWAPADPRTVRVNPRAERLEGRWLYGGHWMQHFGHFVAETLTTLWPEPDDTGDVVGLVFHKYLKRPWGTDPWQLRLLELAGRGGLPVQVVDGRAGRRVESLVVPGRSVVAHGWAHDQARQVWDRVAAPFRGRGGPRRVFLSRTGHNAVRRAQQHRSAGRSTPEWDAAVDRIFEDAGFQVVRPETLPVDEQIALVADAEVVAGASGSALHLSAFSPPSARVLEVGDSRSPGHPVAMQLVVDAVCGHEHAFVRGNLAPAELRAELEGLLS